MNDDEHPADPAPGTLLSTSPCVGICTLDADDRCVGCRRSLAEIRDWSLLTAQQRDAINRRNLPHVHPAVRVQLTGDAGGRQPRRGGRRARRR